MVFDHVEWSTINRIISFNMDIDFIINSPTIYIWMLVEKVNGTLFVFMMHLCLGCGKYMPNDLGLDFLIGGG